MKKMRALGLICLGAVLHACSPVLGEVRDAKGLSRAKLLIQDRRALQDAIQCEGLETCLDAQGNPSHEACQMKCSISFVQMRLFAHPSLCQGKVPTNWHWISQVEFSLPENQWQNPFGGQKAQGPGARDWELKQMALNPAKVQNFVFSPVQNRDWESACSL